MFGQTKLRDCSLVEDKTSQKSAVESSVLGLWDEMEGDKGLAEVLTQFESKARVFEEKYGGPPYNGHNPLGLKPNVLNFVPSITYNPIQLVAPSDSISSSQSVSKKPKEQGQLFVL